MVTDLKTVRREVGGGLAVELGHGLHVVQRGVVRLKLGRAAGDEVFVSQHEGFLDDGVLVVADRKADVGGGRFEAELFEELCCFFGGVAGITGGFDVAEAGFGNGAKGAGVVLFCQVADSVQLNGDLRYHGRG